MSYQTNIITHNIPTDKMSVDTAGNRQFCNTVTATIEHHGATATPPQRQHSSMSTAALQQQKRRVNAHESDAMPLLKTIPKIGAACSPKKLRNKAISPASMSPGAKTKGLPLAAPTYVSLLYACC